MESVSIRIANELNVNNKQVQEAIKLLDEGSTVPFIARYRKEKTGGLNDIQLRELEEKLVYIRELEDRKSTVIKSITEQGKLTEELAAKIQQAETKVKLEDLYLPYKPKRTSKAQIAKKQGLEPLADLLHANPTLDPEQEAAKFINDEIKDAKSALEGARHILMERFSEQAEVIGRLRDLLWNDGLIQAKKVEDKPEDIKFSDYFDHQEKIKTVPSHRMLAMLRGRKLGVIRLKIVLPSELENTADFSQCEQIIADFFAIENNNRAADNWLTTTVRWCWKIKLLPQLEAELITKSRETAESEAINVFADNLKDLLLFPPAGMQPTIGLDPGLRTGVKVAVLDETGKCVEHATIYPHAPQRKWQESLGKLATLCLAYNIKLIGIGNGTASRETDKLVAELIKKFPKLQLTKAIVSEAGASVYSASELASKELPQLDVSIRGAVSIGRRLQDPLAELVKIEPKSIGVGQYQHDVNQVNLTKSLGNSIESCVNKVGVDLNTASCELLSYVSGLNKLTAEKIIDYRNTNGAFTNRQQLMQITRFGAKAFEQSAGFLRIMNADNVLDSSCVHPEAYPLVEKIAKVTNKSIQNMIGDSVFLSGLQAKDFADNKFGEITIKDILKELDKPGRDPRGDFKTATFKEDINNIEDLVVGSILEGVITNVTKFGAFVDVGVHQDGLVHISAITDKFINDPRAVVKVGDIVKVKVISVDVARKRIELSMKINDHVKISSAEKTNTISKNSKANNYSHKKTVKQYYKSDNNQQTKKEKPMGAFGSLLMNARKLRK
jgi:uncharacterized protein